MGRYRQLTKKPGLVAREPRETSITRKSASDYAQFLPGFYLIAKLHQLTL